MAQLTGPSIGSAGPTSQVWTTPFPHKPGDKARDTQGNEYVFCDFTGTVFGGILVAIDDRYNATPLLGTANVPSRVGVAMTAGTSDNGGWVQVYGLHGAVQTGITSDTGASDSAAYIMVPQTSVGSPSGTLTLVAHPTTVSQNVIYGMWLSNPGATSLIDDGVNGPFPTSGVSGPCTETTSATSFIGTSYCVFLNYPYVTGVAVTVETSNS